MFAHDFFEGIVAYDLALHMVKQMWFTYKKLNNRLENFSFMGRDGANKPPSITSIVTRLSGEAVTNWGLLRFIPVILFDCIADVEESNWQLVLRLKDFVELVCSPQISYAQIGYLDAIFKATCIHVKRNFFY